MLEHKAVPPIRPSPFHSCTKLIGIVSGGVVRYGSGQTEYIDVVVVCDDVPREARTQPTVYSSLGSKHLTINICRDQR